MFRYLIVGAALFAFAISLIVWATRSDLIEKDIKKAAYRMERIKGS